MITVVVVVVVVVMVGQIDIRLWCELNEFVAVVVVVVVFVFFTGYITRRAVCNLTPNTSLKYFPKREDRNWKNDD